MKKIICLSDTHGRHKDTSFNDWFLSNPADIILFAGDIQRNDSDDGFDFLSWLHFLPCQHKIIVFGNHDGNSEGMLEEVKKYKDITILNHSSAEVDGITFFGSPYSLVYGNWWFGKTEAELEELYKEIPDKTDFLLTHSPIYGILDKTEEGVNAGSVSLLKRIEQLRQLKYHIGGHIHEAQGISNLGKVGCINASVTNRKYILINEPIIIGY